MFNFKKFVALGIVATMMAGSSVTAFADPGPGDENTAVEATGAGTGAFVDMNKFLIVVPTTDALTSTFAYTVDPLGIVPETDTTHVYEEGAKVFFASDKTKTEVDYASTSKDFTITNKSSIGITLAIEYKLTEGTTGKYEGGYSTTADFTGTGDNAKGLYFGLLADNEVPKAITSTTAATFTNVALNAANEYEVKSTESGYTYSLKTPGTDTVYPTYNMKVKAALNPDVAESVWYNEDSSTKVRTAKAMPTLSVKFTPNGIRDCKEAVVMTGGEGDFYISKATEEGGFGTTKPSALLINGKTVAAVSDNVDGYVHVTWADIYKTWDSTYTSEDKIPEGYGDIIYAGVKSFKFTMGSGDTAVDYYAEIPTE